MAPMVHWPEVMVSYDSCDKVLFSADGFGKFGALDVDEDWDCEARRYYFNIVGKYGGQVQAMLPRVKAKNYEGMELVRPLYFTREANVVEWAEFCGLTFLPCDCPAKKLENDTKRAEIKQLIASLAANNPQIEANIFNAVKNVDTAKLLGWRDANGKHNFLDQFE